MRIQNIIKSVAIISNSLFLNRNALVICTFFTSCYISWHTRMGQSFIGDVVNGNPQGLSVRSSPTLNENDYSSVSNAGYTYNLVLLPGIHN